MRFRRIGLIASLVVGLFAPPLTAHAQHPAKIPRIGVLWLARIGPFIEAFREGLRQRGYVESQNVSVEHRVTGELDRLPELAAELVRLKGDVMVAAGAPSIQAAKHATSAMPIVMAAAADPVATGLVAISQEAMGSVAPTRQQFNLTSEANSGILIETRSFCGCPPPVPSAKGAGRPRSGRCPRSR